VSGIDRIVDLLWMKGAARLGMIVLSDVLFDINSIVQKMNRPLTNERDSQLAQIHKMNKRGCSAL
jgi:hypothetical protein